MTHRAALSLLLVLATALSACTSQMLAEAPAEIDERRRALLTELTQAESRRKAAASTGIRRSG